jgi:tRNA A37 methylthiotransferase MiaB
MYNCLMKIFISDDDMCTTQKLNLARVHNWFIANGCQIIDDIDEADKVICMTCNGWSLLENNSYDRIINLKDRVVNSMSRMIVMGCVVDAHKKKVDEIWDGATVKTKSDKTFSFDEIQELFPDFKIKLDDIPAQSVFRRREDYRDYNLNKRFINIAEGCAFSCTFCTHKPGLGNRRSRPFNEIKDQIITALDEGANIINLMGMETSLWGFEFKSNFAVLLNEVLNINDNFEVHVAQFNASGMNRFHEELLPLFQNKRVTDIQAPIQSTSERILRMMNRKLHFDGLGQFLKEVRKVNSRVILRTDLIVGWPTEKRSELIDSLNFAGSHYDEIAVYSIELSPDLPAWKYKDDAYTENELKEIRKFSVEFLNKNFPNVVVHSGQQDDNTMKKAEKKRIMLREVRKLV